MIQSYHPLLGTILPLTSTLSHITAVVTTVRPINSHSFFYWWMTNPTSSTAASSLASFCSSLLYTLRFNAFTSP